MFSRFTRGFLLVSVFTISAQVQSFSIPQTEQTAIASKVLGIQYRAAQGDKDAQYLFGLMNLAGRYVDKDIETGRLWLEKAANLQHAKAQQALADLTYEGKLFDQDLAVAEHWYQLLAETGNKWANFRLGFIYSAGGNGVERNCGKAMEQFTAVGDDISLGNVAWILATCPEAEYRDGSKALDLSLRLLESNQNDPTMLDNLAAAYAEIGDFSLAVDTQLKAIDALEQSQDIANLDEFQLRLEQYRNQQAYREIIPLLN
ncbi:sel1 repeat family protein [Shewanella maritima]|uniref:tetratricopeptide repeat protein n=1 Tax=Shewanella maritima TaxID=2520507 RepID=UPI00373639F0